MVVHPDRLQFARLIRIGQVLALYAVVVLPSAHAQSERMRLVTQIAGQDQTSAARLARLLAWGSRPWEKTVAAPLVLEQRDPARNIERTFYFALEASDLGGKTPRLPISRREQAFARAVEKVLTAEGRAPWPVFVFCGDTDGTPPPSAFSFATTRRVIFRDGKGSPGLASAILLNRAYWGISDASPLPDDDRVIEIIAKHEVYHAKRAWLRAEQTAVYTDAIEGRLQEAGIFAQDRSGLESLVRQGIVAWEEVAAVDSSLHGAAIPTYRRQNFIEYRERNRDIHSKVVRQFADLFTAVKGKRARRELENWLSSLLRKDLHPRLQ